MALNLKQKELRKEIIKCKDNYMLAIRYLIIFYSFSYIYISIFFLPFSFFFILFYLLVFLVLRTSVGGTVPRGGLVLVWV